MFDTKCRICKFCPAARYLNVRNLFLVLSYLRKIFSENIQDFLAPPQLWYVPQERGGLGRLSSGGLGGQLLLLRAGDLAQVRPLQQHLHLQQGSTPAAPGPLHLHLRRSTTWSTGRTPTATPSSWRWTRWWAATSWLRGTSPPASPCSGSCRQVREALETERGPRSCLENAPNVTLSLLKAISHLRIY